MLELYVFASEKHGQAVLVARLDNLGKGASGAAVQNMRLMLGLAESSWRGGLDGRQTDKSRGQPSPEDCPPFPASPGPR